MGHDLTWAITVVGYMTQWAESHDGLAGESTLDR